MTNTVETKPAADVSISAALVTALLEEQHPDLAHLAPVKCAEGWDNAIFRLGDKLAVRLPRRAASAVLIEHEQRWLPMLAARLPVAVPVPLRTGTPGRLFEWSWSIVPWLPGQSLLSASLQDGDGDGDGAAAATAIVLEQIFLALHQPAPIDAPRNPFRGVPLDARTDALHKHLRQLEGIIDRRPVLACWDRALSASPWTGPPVWLHGDLHPGNLLHHEGRLSGLIDFGDLTSGDPATDLAVLWMLPSAVRAHFNAWVDAAPGVDVDGDVDVNAGGDRDGGGDALKMRARGWALALGLAYLAHSRDDAMLGTLGRTTINAALNEP